jgi:UDP-glucuronate decarboxylase
LTGLVNTIAASSSFKILPPHMNQSRVNNEVSKFTLFISGGTGFFGKALLRHLISHQGNSERPNHLTLLSRSPENFKSSNPDLASLAGIHFHSGDISLPESLPFNARFDGIIHAATDSTNGAALSPLIRYAQIVDGTRHLLDFAVASGAKRFLLTSSGGVYGPQPPQMERIPEDYTGMPDPMQVSNAYSVGKRAAEHLCALYADKYGLEIIVARCFAFVGQDLPLDVHFAIGNFIRDALWANEIIVNGDGSPLRSYLDQRDLANWLIKLLHYGRPGEAYNVGSGTAISIADLAHLVRDIVSPSKTVRILGKPVDNAVRNRYVPDVDKIKNELGLVATYSLEQSIRDAANVAAKRGK